VIHLDAMQWLVICEGIDYAVAISQGTRGGVPPIHYIIVHFGRGLHFLQVRAEEGGRGDSDSEPWAVKGYPHPSPFDHVHQPIGDVYILKPLSSMSTIIDGEIVPESWSCCVGR